MRTTKTIIILIICLWLFQLVNAQSPDCEWVQNHGWIGGIGGFGKITTDVEGNIFMSNDFACSSINFGGITLVNSSWNSNSTICLVKYDSTGNVLWAKTAGGYFNYIKPKSIATDSDGNVFVTGLFRGDSIIFEQVTLRSPFSTGLYNNMFVVKYSADGNVLWGLCANAYATSGSCQGTCIALDSDDRPIVIGKFKGANIIFNSDTIYNTNNSVSSSEDIFIIKFESNGTILWVKGFGGLLDDEANSLCCRNNYMYITGCFYSQEIAFDTIVLTNQVSSGYVSNLFITKLNSAGIVVWAKSNKTDRSSTGVSIVSKTNELIYLSGEFESDHIIFGNDTLRNDYNYEKLFICAIDTTGYPEWAKTSEYDYEAQVNGISADLNGNVYLIGDYRNEKIKFDSIILYNAYYGYKDIFIAKYDFSGQNIWVKSIGGTDNDFGRDITTFNGNTYITGTIWSSSIEVGNNIVNTHSGDYGHDDIFIAKLSGSCTGNTIVNQTGDEFKLEGETATYSVAATGSPIIKYQWYRNGYQISGANSPSYTTPELTSSYDGSAYYCIVSNCDYCNSSTSIVDTLVVCTEATAYLYLLNQELTAGDSAVFMIYASGSPPFYYQWYKNDSFILGADSAIYTTPVLTELDSGNVYYCKVTNCKNLSTYQSNSVNINISTGLHETQNAPDKIKIYPNPSNGEITIETDQINREYKISLFNLHGQELMRQIMNRSVARIDISKFNWGMYILKVESDKIERVRIIKNE